ncbi:hypothetical protein SAMN05443247_03028 [Bradyrhizobium erythrophlei]|jgi:hypothetical protein|nr:hypothetical protein SAMN05443247_03028 [Bradyrhizobium erythrophlei]
MGLPNKHPYHVNFVHCNEQLSAMPYTRRGMDASSAWEPLELCLKRQALGLAASIAALLTIWPISLACSARDRI